MSDKIINKFVDEIGVVRYIDFMMYLLKVLRVEVIKSSKKFSK